MYKKSSLYLVIFFLVGIISLAWLLVSEEISQASPGVVSGNCPDCIYQACGELPPVCNNDGVKDPGEECDGADFDGETCVTLGFTGGVLACHPNCTFDTSGCVGAPPPQCSDGIDNDGDGFTDFPADPQCTNASDNDEADGAPPPPKFIINPLDAESFEELIEGIINFVFWVAIVIAPLMVIIAAFYFLTSAGDPEKIRKAKSIIFWTIVGFAIVLLAKGIISVIKQIIGG